MSFEPSPFSILKIVLWPEKGFFGKHTAKIKTPTIIEIKTTIFRLIIELL
jgi:hypothetical protein